MAACLITHSRVAYHNSVIFASHAEHTTAKTHRISFPTYPVFFTCVCHVQAIMGFLRPGLMACSAAHKDPDHHHYPHPLCAASTAVPVQNFTDNTMLFVKRTRPAAGFPFDRSSACCSGQLHLQSTLVAFAATLFKHCSTDTHFVTFYRFNACAASTFGVCSTLLLLHAVRPKGRQASLACRQALNFSRLSFECREAQMNLGFLFAPK